MPDERVVKLIGPIGVTSISIGGVQLPVIDGLIEVPEKFEAQLGAHGFVRYVAPEKPAAKPASAPAVDKPAASAPSKPK
jgi:hypothetical protein